MTDEKDKILSMLEEGAITAEEANVLLEAVEDVGQDAAQTAAPLQQGPPPDRAVVREAWRLPFNVSLIVTALAGSLLWRSRRAAGIVRILSTIVLLPLTLISSLSALLFYLSKNGPWLFLRIKSEEGRDFSFSLPFPLDWARGAIDFIQRQEPETDVREKLEMASEFLAAVEASDLQEPVSVDISDEGGHVEVYLVQ